MLVRIDFTFKLFSLLSMKVFYFYFMTVILIYYYMYMYREDMLLKDISFYTIFCEASHYVKKTHLYPYQCFFVLFILKLLIIKFRRLQKLFKFIFFHKS